MAPIEDGRGRIWEIGRTEQGPPLGELFRCDVICCIDRSEMARVPVLSILVVSAGQAKKSTLLPKASCKLQRARASSGAHALETWASTIGARGHVKTPEECQAKTPWNRDCGQDASRMAYCALADDDLPAFSALVEHRSTEGMQSSFFLLQNMQRETDRVIQGM